MMDIISPIRKPGLEERAKQRQRDAQKKRQYIQGPGNVAEYLQINEMTAPTAGAADTGRIFCQDNGAGKTQLMVIFNTGAAQQIAIQP